MKVLHVIPSLGPLRGGPSVALPLLARALTQHGIEVDVITTDDNGPARLDIPREEWTSCNGYRVRYFPRQGHFYTFSWPLSHWVARHVREYDLVHIHGLFSHAATVSAWAAHRAEVPYVCRPLGTLQRWGFEHRRPMLKRFSLRVCERPILERAAAIQFTSQQELAEACDLGVSFQPAVIPIGVDLEPFERLPPPDRFLRRFAELSGKDIILFLSRFDPKKGLDLLLPAFASLHPRFPNASLVLAGDGDPEYVQALHYMAIKHEISDRVTLTGFLAGDEKLEALAAAAIFVLPSYSENFGIAAVEAMAARCPIVISDGVGICQDVAASSAGLVVQRDAGVLSRALATMLADRELRTRCADNGYALVAERFSTHAAARSLTALYEDILSRPPGRSSFSAA